MFTNPIMGDFSFALTAMRPPNLQKFFSFDGGWSGATDTYTLIPGEGEGEGEARFPF